MVTPFLPGDSLLFAAGTFAALGHLALVPLMTCLIAAAVVGDAVNYAVGQFLGARGWSLPVQAQVPVSLWYF